MVKLSEHYLITPHWPLVKLLPYLTEALAQGVQLIQIRSQVLSRQDLEFLLDKLRNMSPDIQVLINSAYPESFAIAKAFSVGVHLQSNILMRMSDRIFEASIKTAASCHNLIELKQAEKIGLDFAVLSPVKTTLSHADAVPLGWHQFKGYAEQVTLPIFSLGGMALDDFTVAKKNGAYGIAGIGLFLRRYSSS